MSYSPPSRCSVCGGELKITRLSCEKCGSELTGSFTGCRYCALNEKQKLFLETFLKSRGNIKEVERSLSLSYPTVKSLLDDLLGALYPGEIQKESGKITTAEILDKLEHGEITAEQAAEMLAKTGAGQ